MERRPRPPRPNPLPKVPQPRPPSPGSAVSDPERTGWERFAVLVPASDGRADDGDGMPARTRPHGPRLDELSEAWLFGYRDLAAVRPNLTGRVLGAEVEQNLTGVAA